MRNVWKYIVTLLLLVALFFYWQWADGWGWKSKVYQVASGQPGAGYYTVTKGMLDMSNKSDVAIQLGLIESDGSVENMKLLSNGDADFGLVQIGGDVDDNLRSVANIYHDVVHILIRSDDPLASLSGLDGKRVACGLPGSGTLVVSSQLLEHYGLGGGKVSIVNASPKDSINMLIDGGVDAVILVTAAHAPVVVDGVLSGEVKHFSLGACADVSNEAYGFCLKYQKFNAAVLPKHTYGRMGDMESALPTEAVSVVSVPSLLVCRNDLNEGAVYEITRALYSNKHVLGKHYNSLHHLSEPKDLDQFIYPLHEGAKNYYQRRAPGFLVVYAEVIALLLSVAITLYGVISATRQWSAVKHKNRIDEYYKKLNDSLKRIQSGNLDMANEKKMLIDLRSQAYDELVTEELYANESFRIFQDLLEQCLSEVRGK